MKKTFIGISVIALISALILSSCDNNEYTPIQAGSRSCNIEIECIDINGHNLLNDKAFTDKIKIDGENSHSDIRFTISSGRLCFEADLPDQNDMKWSNENNEASDISNITVRLGKQKAHLKCYISYIANLPPASIGGVVTLEHVEYNGQIYKRTGNKVSITLHFNRNGKLEKH